VLSKLSLEQLQEALICLYSEMPPKDSVLRNLQSEEWGVLHLLLNGLLNEKDESSLH
jgi:hypothetical protein